jgi:hypothetical protein
MQLSKPPKPKATRKRLKKEILSDDFKNRKIFWKMLPTGTGKFSMENFPPHITSHTPVEMPVRSVVKKRGPISGLIRAMAQAVTRRPLTADARVRAGVSPCGTCGGQSGTGTGFFPEFSGFSFVSMSPPWLCTHISSGDEQ